MQNIALAIMILAVPFNGLPPLIGIGELSREGFFYASLLYAVASLPMLHAQMQRHWRIVPVFMRTQIVYVVLIGFSFALNSINISDNAYGIRSGSERYLLGLLVYLYYFFIFCVLALHAKAAGIERFVARLATLFSVLGVILIVMNAMEIASWYDGQVRNAFFALREVLIGYGWTAPLRLSGVSMEPAFNSFVILLCIPWAFYFYSQKKTFWRLSLPLALIVVCVLSAARTAWLTLAFMAAAWALTRGIARRLLPSGLDGATFVIASFALGIVAPLWVFQSLDGSSSISDITRSYVAAGAVEAGLDRPFTGQGFAQVTFYVMRKFQHSVMQQSWELLDFYQGARADQLPPIYSWYARSFGEFGAIGYGVLAIGFATAMRRAFQALRCATDGVSRNLCLLSIFMLTEFLGIAATYDSLKSLQYWFAWFCIALLSAHARQRQPAAVTSWRRRLVIAHA